MSQEAFQNQIILLKVKLEFIIMNELKQDMSIDEKLMMIFYFTMLGEIEILASKGLTG